MQESKRGKHAVMFLFFALPVCSTPHKQTLPSMAPWRRQW